MRRAVIVLAVLFAGVSPSAEVIEQVLVKVNGEIITLTEFQKAQVAAVRELPNQGDLNRLGNAELSKALAQVTPRLIVSMVDELILLQRAKELGLAVSDAQFNDVLASIKKDNKIESDELFEAALRSEGITLAQLRESLSKRMLVGQVQRREVGGRLEVTEAEERAYYDANPADFATTPSVTLRELVVNAELDPVKKAASVGALDDARAKAEEIRARSLKGEAFEKVAGELSDAPSKANGGLVGPISREELNEQLAKMVATMKVGDVTPVMNNSTGAHFFKLEASVDSTIMSFEAARGRIADRLGQEKFAAEVRKVMQRLRSQALIEWKSEDLRKAWEIGISAEPTF